MRRAVSTRKESEPSAGDKDRAHFQCSESVQRTPIRGNDASVAEPEFELRPFVCPCRRDLSSAKLGRDQQWQEIR